LGEKVVVCGAIKKSWLEYKKPQEQEQQIR
jgi:hypothetical protein